MSNFCKCLEPKCSKISLREVFLSRDADKFRLTRYLNASKRGMSKLWKLDISSDLASSVTSMMELHLKIKSWHWQWAGHTCTIGTPMIKLFCLQNVSSSSSGQLLILLQSFWLEIQLPSMHWNWERSHGSLSE